MYKYANIDNDILIDNFKKIRIKKNNISILKKSVAQDFSFLKKKTPNNYYLFVGLKTSYDEIIDFNNFETIKINKNFSLSFNKNVEPMIDYEN